MVSWPECIRDKEGEAGAIELALKWERIDPLLTQDQKTKAMKRLKEIRK